MTQQHQKAKVSDMKLENNVEAGTMEVRGGIGDYEGYVSASDFKTLLAEHDGGDIVMTLSSEGGCVTEGLECYNAMMSYSGKITIVVDVLAASIASIMAMAADTLIVKSTAQMMLHRCWCLSAGNAIEFRSLADVMDKLDGQLAEVYAEKAGGEKEDWINVMTAETWYTADEAVAAGLADEVLKVEKDRQAKAGAKKPLVVAPSIAASVVKANNTARRLKLRLR
jgi:ATP-dependent protease ClpP protease subunit